LEDNTAHSVEALGKIYLVKSLLVFFGQIPAKGQRLLTCGLRFRRA
jgi:hypothetical protein